MFSKKPRSLPAAKKLIARKRPTAFRLTWRDWPIAENARRRE